LSALLDVIRVPVTGEEISNLVDGRDELTPCGRFKFKSSETKDLTFAPSLSW
jgi:hypothetical protein